MTTRPNAEHPTQEERNRKRWRQIDALFAGALEHSPAEREDFLEVECAGDPELRRAVEELLANDAEAGDFLESPALAAAGDVDPDSGRARAGDFIGPYRIERELDRGGMGSVYLAYRADDAYQRQVAIKLLDRASEAMVRRFRGERQILASLDHPHVAGLFEGGETPDGRPYLVMEYVDGVPIDEYADREELSVERRLTLFLKVCSAVHYAHQNLVVHRDIKPSNVLVNAAGEPRLLDFGIAKLLDPEAFPLTLDQTATGVRPMTPHYASPEQVRGGTITTASDVYSLGVLLYKLLTGRLPHRLSGLSVLEVERVLAEETPVKASVAARPRPAARRLAGDLDNIVAMALRREPGRRYGSAEQLAQDIERHLTGRPVMARRDTFGYGMSVFLRRNKVAAAVAGLILAMIVAFAVSSARQAAETARQRDRAQLERDKARQVSAFLVDIFQEVDPWKASKRDLTVRAALDRGAVKIERELESQPEVRAALQETIGTVYINLGLHEQAAPHLEAALETMQSHLGEAHPDIAIATAKVATVYRRRVKYEEAERLYRRALEILEATETESLLETSAVHVNLSRLYRVQGRFAEAQEHAERALAILEDSPRPEPLEIAKVLNALAGVATRQGDPATATGHLERALDLQLRSGAEISLQTAAIYANLGVLQLEAGAHSEAERLLERSLELHRQLLEEPHPTIAGLFVVMGNLAKARENRELAEQHLRRALDGYEQFLGGEHDLVANCLYYLGLVVFEQGRAGEAEPLLERSLAIREKALGPDHHFVAEGLRGLGQLAAAQNRHAEAEQLFLRALDIWQKHPRQQGTQGVPEAYASFLRATGRAAEAAELEKRAQEGSSRPNG